MRFGVLGGGSWATALVKILSENNDKVCWYMRNKNTAKHIREEGHNPKYLSSVSFDPNRLFITHSLEEVIEKSDVLVIAIPSPFLSEVLAKTKNDLKDKIVFSAVKGIVPESKLIIGEHLNQHCGVPMDKIGVITGPCHAEEVALEKLSYLTVACQNITHAARVADNLSCAYIRTKVSDDIIGTEYAATLKNIYAIAAGMAHGLGYGDNFQSVLMSNSIREMKRFIKKMHKIKRNINNSAYLGDLLVTGYSTFSRNRMLGNMIGKGYTVKSAIMEMTMVSEGYYAAQTAYLLAKDFNKEFPIIEAVYTILYQQKPARKVMSKLCEKLD